MFICLFLKQIFDAAIIITSFVLDLVFVGRSVGSESEQAAIIIMVFLLWRILRIVNGTYELEIGLYYTLSEACLVSDPFTPNVRLSLV